MGQKRANAAYEMIDAEVLQRLRCGRLCDYSRRWRDLGMRLSHDDCKAPFLLGTIGD
jgi:hypothetical protein